MAWTGLELQVIEEFVEAGRLVDRANSWAWQWWHHFKAKRAERYAIWWWIHGEGRNQARRTAIKAKCPECDQVWSRARGSAGSRKRFCSPACRSIAYNRMLREITLEESAARLSGVCAHCGSVWHRSPTPGPMPKYCTEKCANAAKRARHKVRREAPKDE